MYYYTGVQLEHSRTSMMELFWENSDKYMMKQAISPQSFYSLSSTNFTWSILEYHDPYDININIITININLLNAALYLKLPFQKYSCL